MDKGELMVKYAIKSVQGGQYGDGFWDAIKFMDKKYCHLEKVLENQKDLTKHYAKLNKGEQK
jgi:hypothetical protein